MGFIDPAFKNIKAGQEAFLIWRVENFELKPIQRSHYGSFYEGDTYIIYSAAPPIEKVIQHQIKVGQNKLEYHIHFWMGSKTTTDESTTAVIKVVELHEILGGLTTHYREVQGHESERFRSYFKNGIRILKGGVASGFRPVTDEFTVRLFKIKGRRRPLLIEQSSVSWEHFNSGDVFILETKSKIFVWIGKESNKMEKFQAGKVAVQLREEGTDRTVVFMDEDRENSLEKGELDEFEKYLNLSERVIKPAESDVVDSQTETQFSKSIKLYRCTDESGTFNTIHVKNGPLNQADLKSEDSYIVDNNMHGIWVWIGKKASEQERTKGMTIAYEFIKNNDYPPTTSLRRVVDGAEPVEFRMLFSDWKDSEASTGFGPQYSINNIANTINMKFDATKLHDVPALAADTQLIDDGSGKTQVWRLHGDKLEPVPDDNFGIFFSGDCYLILYTNEVHGKKNYMLYFWLGAHSGQDERGAIAWHAVKKDEELNGVAVQVRVVQSKEPPHFLIIFKGKMIVFNGGYASSFDGPNGKDIGIPQNFLVHVKGGEDHTTKSVEVEFSSSSLNTNDVFVLHTENKSYVWCGKGSTGDERERAKAIAEEWSKTKEYQVLFEGHEQEDFWNILGGKQPYANNERLANPEILVPARLFQCSNATGYFKAEEILNFCQQDLVPEDVMVLDIGKAVFIWIGKGANKSERKEAPKLVEQYLTSDPRGRDLDIPIITVQQGYEPPNFTGFFGAWDKHLWETTHYQELTNEVLGDSNVQINSLNDINKSRGEITKYPISVLTNKDGLPEDVDVLHKELHLSEEDFVEAFGINRTQYNSLPEWKRNNLKKAAGLF